MGSILDNLINNLDEQIETLKQCESLLASQQDSLVKNDIDSLRINMSHQNRLISKSKGLERRRSAIVNEYLKETGSDESDMKLIAFCKKVDPEYSDRLMDLRNTLKNSMDRVNRLRQQNELLINQSMELINGTMKVYLKEDKRGMPSYNAGGNAPTQRGIANMVLDKVV